MAGRSIQKRETQDGKAYYMVRVEYPRDPVTGKRRQQSQACHTKKEAEHRLAEWLTEIERGTAVDSSKMTTGELVTYWLSVHAHNLRPSASPLARCATCMWSCGKRCRSP